MVIRERNRVSLLNTIRRRSMLVSGNSRLAGNLEIGGRILANELSVMRRLRGYNRLLNSGYHQNLDFTMRSNVTLCFTGSAMSEYTRIDRCNDLDLFVLIPTEFSRGIDLVKCRSTILRFFTSCGLDVRQTLAPLSGYSDSRILGCYRAILADTDKYINIIFKSTEHQGMEEAITELFDSFDMDCVKKGVAGDLQSLTTLDASCIFIDPSYDLIRETGIATCSPDTTDARKTSYSEKLMNGITPEWDLT